ncbi:hypothetical protein ACAG39_09185 [Caldicellulosiruptoraceae bacterium PP1]
MERRTLPKRYMKLNRRKISITGIFKVTILLCIILLSIYIKFFDGIQTQGYKIFKTIFLNDQVNLTGLYKTIDGLLNKEEKKINKKEVKNEEHAIFPAEGILNKNSDGSYFIIINKEANVISPCSGTILSIEKIGEGYDILIDDNKNIYSIKNISILYQLKIGESISKGKLLGKIKPNASNQQGFLYYKVINK